MWTLRLLKTPGGIVRIPQRLSVWLEMDLSFLNNSRKNNLHTNMRRVQQDQAQAHLDHPPVFHSGPQGAHKTIKYLHPFQSFPSHVQVLPTSKTKGLHVPLMAWIM